MSLAVWAPAAEKDIEDIYAYIAHRDFRRDTAKRIVRGIRETVDEWAAFFAAGHLIGTARPDLGESYRVIAHKRWVIVVRVINAGMEVMRVVDGSRNYDKLFGN